MRILIFALAFSSSVVFSSTPARSGENWPQFRGPTADGHSDSTGLPLTWSQKQNIVWETPIHDRGWSSPLIWANQIWLTTATANGRQLFAVCVDRDTGKIIHDVKVFDTANPQHIAASNSYASPTGAIEAGRVYVHYGTYGTACLDTGSGKVLWQRRDLNCDHHEGPGSSVMLWQNLLIIHVDGRDVQYIIALDKTTGETAWKTKRSVDYTAFRENERKAFSTPIVVEINGQPQLISQAAKAVYAYDPANGQEIWRIRYNGWSIAPRPIFAQGLLFIVTDYDRSELWAVRPGDREHRGDLSASNIVWKIPAGASLRPSLLLVDDLLFLLRSDGILQCLQPKTGQQIWKQRLPGTYSASPIYADGRIYCFNHDGVTTVLQPAREFKQLAVNQLDPTELMATPAISGKAIFLRTATHLYRIQ